MNSQQSTQRRLDASRDAFPALQLSISDALPGASFALARADIRWSTAHATTGWGRDANPLTAQCKALGEAVERHAYARLPQACRNQAQALADDGEKYLSPVAMLGYAPEQYKQIDFPFAPYSEQQSYWWLPARHAIDQTSVWIVADLVCSPRAFEPDYRARLLTHATSSGCASATHIDTAAFQATLELVERDAYMRHWFAQQGGIAILPASLPGNFQARINALRAAGCSTGVQCLDLGRHPVWLVWAQHAPLHFTSIGLASGLDAEVALDTALSELETQAMARLEGVPPCAILPEQVHAPADHAALYATSACFERADALGLGRLAKPEAEMQDFNRVVAGFHIGIPALYRRLARHGHPVYLVDLSVPEADALRRGAAGYTAASTLDSMHTMHAIHTIPRIHTIRALAPGLIPLAFGREAMPLAMDSWRHPGSRFIHPFC